MLRGRQAPRRFVVDSTSSNVWPWTIQTAGCQHCPGSLVSGFHEFSDWFAESVRIWWNLTVGAVNPPCRCSTMRNEIDCDGEYGSSGDLSSVECAALANWCYAHDPGCP